MTALSEYANRMSETPVYRSHMNFQRLVVSTPYLHWMRGPITTRTCGSEQAQERRKL